MTDQIDPVRADEVSCIASDADVVIVFNRKVFSRSDTQYNAMPVPSAAVSIPWALALQLRDILAHVQEKRAEAAQQNVQ